MIIELPDAVADEQLTPEQIRVELACALYAAEKIGKIRGSQIAGLDFFEFQRALGDRHISTYTAADLTHEVEAMDRLFSTPPAV